MGELLSQMRIRRVHIFLIIIVFHIVALAPDTDGKIADIGLEGLTLSAAHIAVAEVKDVGARTTFSVEEVLKGSLPSSGFEVDHTAYNKKNKDFICALPLEFKKGQRYVLFLTDKFSVIHYYKGAVLIAGDRDNSVITTRSSVYHSDLPNYLEAIRYILKMQQKQRSAGGQVIFDELANHKNVFLRRVAFIEKHYWMNNWTEREKEFPGKRALRGRLLKGLKDSDNIVRFYAIDQFGNYFGNKENREIFENMLSDPEAWVRLRAAQSLRKIKEKASVPRLIEAYRDNEAKRGLELSAIEDALRFIGGDDASRFLVGKNAGLARPATER